MMNDVTVSVAMSAQFAAHRKAAAAAADATAAAAVAAPAGAVASTAVAAATAVSADMADDSTPAATAPPSAPTAVAVAASPGPDFAVNVLTSVCWPTFPQPAGASTMANPQPQLTLPSEILTLQVRG